MKSKKVVPASTLVRDAGEHAFDLPNDIRAAPRLAPQFPGERIELVAQRPGDRPGARERLQFPKLRPLFIVSAQRFERTNERSLFALGTKARVDRRDAALRARLRQRAHQVLRGARILAQEHDIEISAVSDLTAAEFSERDEGERFAGIQQSVNEDETGFRQIVLLGEQRRQRREIQNIAQQNSQQLALPINPHRIEIVGGCA